MEGAGALLAESGDPGRLSIRGVARRVGIAPMSVYLHFPDVDSLVLAVAERFFAELAAAQAGAASLETGPLPRLLARCRAYCRFGLAHPGQYRLMFRAELASGMTLNFDEVPGREAFADLVDAVTAVVGSEDGAQELATLVWAEEHGLVSLRLSRPRFPWPPIEALIDTAVRRLVGAPAGIG